MIVSIIQLPGKISMRGSTVITRGEGVNSTEIARSEGLFYCIIV